MKDVEEKKIAVTDEEKKAVTDGVAKLKEVKDKDDVEEIKKVSEELSKAGQAVGMKMYQSDSAKASADKATGGANPTAENPLATDEKKDENGNEPLEGEVVDDKK